ncbi:MAG TPA: pyruvate formate lyase-activating protein, partial [Peptococcaceae bacterium]|nr:pyruvate formate lyase-activating protein [Peptococcaceae bacterium]
MSFRGRILAIDIGAGTQDILLYEDGIPVENCVKMVVPSATTQVAGKIARATAAGRDIYLSGHLMGGGPM